MTEEKKREEEVVEEKLEEAPETDEPTKEAAAESEETVETLRVQLEEESKKAEEYLEQWKRSAAEFSNYRKRNDKEKGELVKFSNAILITRLLPILDDLDRAFQTLPTNMRDLTWIDGIALVERKLQALLEQDGLTAIEAQGKPFDPILHQAIMYEETAEHDDGAVMEELQKGYKLKDRVIRPTLVKVAKNVAPAAEDGAKESATEEENVEE